MTSAGSDPWAVALWKHYFPGIATGAPFYLAADRLLIRELYLTELHGEGSTDVALRAFHEVCLGLLDSTGTRTIVRQEAFQRVPGRTHSRAICLAVQQVLVVENMLQDAWYSEQSYFPRYRELLGISDSHAHSSPMSTAMFREIWEFVARELSAVAGAGERTITFFAGRGPDRNRSFPLSQALFTSHDLTVIREESPALDERTDVRSMTTELLRVREHLGVRARRLIATAAIDATVAGRLCTQVRSFLSSDVLASLRTTRARASETGRIVAYLDRADSFDVDSDEDSFSVYHRSEAEQTLGNVLEAALRGRLASAPVVFLVPDADGFCEWSPADDVEPGDAVLVIIEAAKADGFRAQVAQSYGASFVPAKSNLSERFELVVCSSGLGPRISLILGLPGHPTTARGIELEGGLCADARSRIFLAAYPPTGIRHNGRLLTGEEEIVTGGAHRRVAEFLETLRNQSEDVRYTIQVGQAALSFSVASQTQSSTSRPALGYALRDGELDLVACPIGPGQSSLRGTRFSGAASQGRARLSTQDLLILTARGRRVALSDARAAIIVAEIRLLGPENLLAILATRQVAATRSVPLRAVTSGLLSRLEVENEEKTTKPIRKVPMLKGNRSS